MGHPYNQTQQIELRNLSAQRFVGTSIQKNILYGRDIPVVRFDWTGTASAIQYDVGTINYDLLKSGDYIPTYLDNQYLDATGFYIVRGEPFDIPRLSAVHSGLEQGIPFDRAEIAYITSGSHEPCVREIAYNGHEYLESYVVYIDYDRPTVHANPLHHGDMLGLTKDDETAGYFFLTGLVFAGDHIPVEQTPQSTIEPYGPTQFFFYTGRVDGPQS